jgi:hypothetical protein
MKVTQAINYDEVRNYIKNSSKESAIYVGVDSQQFKLYTRFAIVIVIHIDSSHGGKLFVETVKTDRIKEMRQRLMKEVELAVTTSIELIDAIGKRRFEVHLDINGSDKHKSNSVCKEALAYVKGQGFTAMIKPNSWCASNAADHLVKN